REAAEVAVAGHRVRPDSLTFAQDAIQVHLDVLGPRAFAMLYEWTAIDPLSGWRLAEAAQWRNRWGGGRIAALTLLQQAERFAPEEARNVSFVRDEVFASLGWYEEQSESYLNRQLIGESERYIGWYDSFRAGAQSSTTIRRPVVEDYRARY